MKTLYRHVAASGLLLMALPAAVDGALGQRLPWRQAGLSEREAAAHLLDRFAYGPRPGEIEDVVALGLGNWIEGQLAGDLPGSLLSAKLGRLSVLTLEPREIIKRYSYDKGYLARQAVSEGVITLADYQGKNGEGRRRDALAALEQFSMRRGNRPEAELLSQLRTQKVLRAVYSESQLVEVLTDFWFNHFNVSVSDRDARVHVVSYERDAIRPHVLGPFRQLLGATAKHPAMLSYLDNDHSVANANVTTTFDLEVSDLDRLSPLDNPSLRQQLAKAVGWTSRETRRQLPNQPRGLNENYARELLELHTLGVGGGYSQYDVIEVARALTGWTTFPSGGLRARIEDAVTSPTAADMGFVVDGEFVFRSDQHDSEAKTVLGVSLEAGRGIEDGEEVLDLLARHPSTARHLMRKLAIRLVSERPAPALVDRLVNTWDLSGGDLSQIIRSLVESPEFWRTEARRSKIKTPFELVVSALRILDVDVSDPQKIIQRIRVMSQNLYAYSAPTGFPDRGDRWTHVGPLLARVNFGLELAAGRVKGAEVDLLQRLGQRRITAMEEAIALFFPLILPGRDPRLTLELLGADDESLLADDDSSSNSQAKPGTDLVTRKLVRQAVGILLSSPEFQVH